MSFAMTTREKAGVAVRALEWSDPSPPSENCRYDNVKATCALGEYSIEWKSWKEHDRRAVYLQGGLSDFLANEDTLEQAKAAAQADYNRRVLSALDRSGEADLVAAMREARDDIPLSVLSELIDAIDEPSRGHEAQMRLNDAWCAARRSVSEAKEARLNLSAPSNGAASEPGDLVTHPSRQCERYPSHTCNCRQGKPLCLSPEDAAIYHGDIDGDGE